MRGALALLDSKKAVVTGVLLIAVSVMCAFKVMTVEQWIDYTKWLGGIYLSAEAVDSGMGKFGESLANKPKTRVDDPVAPRVREQE